jgi:hypothetical protein
MVPSFKLGFTKTESPSNPLGIKGCGEAGAIAAPAALMNAVTNALGVKDVPMPATPQTHLERHRHTCAKQQNNHRVRRQDKWKTLNITARRNWRMPSSC